MDINFKVKDDKFKVKSVNLCDYMDEYWAGTLSVNVDGQERTPIELLPKVFPGKDNAFASEFVVLEKYVNGMKERVSSPCSQLSQILPAYLTCRCGAASSSSTMIR